MPTLDAVVATYGTNSNAQEALRTLKDAAFDMKKVSILWRDHSSENDPIGFYILGRDYDSEEHVIGFPDANRRLKFWGQRERLWGRSWGTLFGSGLFLVPGIGHVVVLGPLVRCIVEGLEDNESPAGLTALGAGLARIGIPKADGLRYEATLRTEQALVVTEGGVAASKRLLAHTGSLCIDEYCVSAMLGQVAIGAASEGAP